jgi:hypothetical protein
MLWSVGAAAGVVLLRQWPQVLWLAVLAPAWLWGEWVEVQGLRWWYRGDMSPAAVGLFGLACAYVMAKGPDDREPWRRVLAWLGAIALIPAALEVSWGDPDYRSEIGRPDLGVAVRAAGWALAVAIPLAVGGFLRRRESLWLFAALAWAVVLALVSPREEGGELATYALFSAGAVGVVLWGIRDRQRLAINVGVLGFALSVLGFYFANVFDKLGRSLGLIGLGVLFIGGGWWLERMRRRLVARATAVRT